LATGGFCQPVGKSGFQIALNQLQTRLMNTSELKQARLNAIQNEVEQLPNYLLAGFSSPYEIAERSVAQAMQEAAELYIDVSC
jgi:hypothetical protein